MGFQGTAVCMSHVIFSIHSLKSYINSILRSFQWNKTAWPWKLKVTTSKDFFTDPVHENLLGYLKDSAVPFSFPAAAGQQKPKSTETNQLPQHFNDCSWDWVFTQIELETLKNSDHQHQLEIMQAHIELAVQTWDKHQRQRSRRYHNLSVTTALNIPCNIKPTKWILWMMALFPLHPGTHPFWLASTCFLQKEKSSTKTKRFQSLRAAPQLYLELLNSQQRLCYFVIEHNLAQITRKCTDTMWLEQFWKKN